MLINRAKVEKNFNVPNALSILRIAIIFPFVYYFLKDDYVVAAIMIGVSGLSDMFDGIIARKLNQVTKLGAMLDPISDKLTLTAVVVCLGIKIPEITPIIVVLIIKEALMLAAGAVLLKRHKAPAAAQWYGKLATVAFYVSVAIIVLLKAIWGIENVHLTTTLMAITVVLMIFALIKYFILFLNILNSDTDKVTDNEAK